MRTLESRTSSDSHHGLEAVYDSKRNVVVVILHRLEEELEAGLPGMEVWEWDGETWTEREHPGLGPPRREHFALAYDSRRGVTTLFGGYLYEDGSPNNFGDLWEWDGDTWTERHPVGPRPAARQHRRGDARSRT